MPKKVKINPLILIAMTASSITMGAFAYNSFTTDHLQNGILFTLLAILFISFVLWGMIRNRNIDKKE